MRQKSYFQPIQLLIDRDLKTFANATNTIKANATNTIKSIDSTEAEVFCVEAFPYNRFQEEI